MSNQNDIFDVPAQTGGGSNNIQHQIKSARIETMATADDTIDVCEHSTPHHPAYPYNKVKQTISGHLIEEDDTPGAERLMRMHKSGTFEEIHADGSKIVKIFGDDFYVVLAGHSLFVGGALNITCESDANLLVKGNLRQKVGGDYHLTVHGNYTSYVHGTTLQYSKGKIDIQSESTISTLSGGYTYIKAVGTYYLAGSAGRWNSGSAPENKDLNPGPGLELSDSLIEPSVSTQMILRTGNPELGQIKETDITYPKDRKELA